MRHWNTIAATLLKGEVYLPLLLKDENGVEHGNDWARGFMRGMHMRQDGWAELINDDEHVGCLIPVMMLCHEHDGDPTKRPKPISPREREKVITYMAAGLLGAYRYFGPSGRLMQVASKRLGVTVPRLVETSRVHAGRKRNTRTAAAVPLSSEPQGSARLSQAEQRLGVAHPS
jgi:uncharacterized protein